MSNVQPPVTADAAVAEVVVPAFRPIVSPAAKVLLPVTRILPTVEEATKYPGATATPLMYTLMPRNVLTEHRIAWILPANVATMSGATLPGGVPVAVHVGVEVPNGRLK